jgi:hypothetical protein
MRALPYIESQVNITKDGYNIQCSLQEYRSYWKQIGWSIIGRAPALPLMAEIPTANGQQPEELAPETLAEYQTSQGRLFA